MKKSNKCLLLTLLAICVVSAVVLKIFLCDKSRCAKQTAITAMQYSFGGEDKVKCTPVSCDSIVDGKVFTETDHQQLMAVMDELSKRTMESLTNFDFKNMDSDAIEANSLAGQQANYLMEAIMRQEAHPVEVKNKLTGWKVTVNYRIVAPENKAIRGIRIFVVTPDGKSVLDHYDVPVL